MLKPRKMETLNTEPIENLYAIANRNHTKWGLKEMPPMKIYQDTNGIAKPKSVKPTKKAKNFIEQLEAYHAQIPGPKYKHPSFWSQPDENSIKIKYGDRRTFLDEIQRREKNHPIPGPGEYKSTDSKKSFISPETSYKHIKSERRINYFENLIEQQIDTPGPGAYSQISKPIRDFKFKVTKSRLPVAGKPPGPMSYKPDNPSYFTFDKPKKVHPIIKLLNCKSSKFETCKKNSSPGPNLGQSEWKTGWMEKISKPPQFSIYYD